MSQVTAQELIQLLTVFPRPERRNERSQLREAINGFITRIKDEDILQHEILSSPLKLAISRVASDLHIFEILAKAKSPVSTDELAEETRASKKLLARILPYLASQDFISSPTTTTWGASILTSPLANPAFAAGLRFGTSCVMPSTMALPPLLADNVFKDMSELENTAFQVGKSTLKRMYEWLGTHPEIHGDFQTWMAESQRRYAPVYDILPLEEFVTSPSNHEVPLFVDVGGGNGHVCAQIRQKYPHWKGRIINQDLQATAIKIDLCQDTIEHYDHDFFNEQPVKAANIYHLRNILHNWSDEECIKILRQVSKAMDSASVAIIEVSAISEENVSWYASYVDIVMGMFFGSRLRTLHEYMAIVEQAGLIWTRSLSYGEGSTQHVIVSVKA
ncbi:S-adenosyl-L-methionine-dependent methyltransferase [Xylaria sp. FL0043]|nr:S-adenosyl-L-methionine-dependent methyltransferase [Xylaria sp. FL0043]